MLSTIRLGSSNADVVVAQAQINLAFAAAAPLVLDGKFGQLTDASVRDFQDASGLDVDGIVGPDTWAALGAVPNDTTPVANAFLCDTGNPASQAQGLAFANNARQLDAIQNSPGFVGSSSSFGSSGSSSPQPVVGTNIEAVARAVYGDSLLYDLISFTNLSGISGRPFTVSPTPTASAGASRQILNLGNAPSDSTIIHEMAHVWQSQHSSAGARFMANCVACQGAALRANTRAGLFDSSVRANSDWPANFPFSAYGYRPGKAFGAYAGEQIAEQIENDESGIRALVSGKPPGVVVADNEASIAVDNISFEDLRAAGVKT